MPGDEAGGRKKAHVTHHGPCTLLDRVNDTGRGDRWLETRIGDEYRPAAPVACVILARQPKASALGSIVHRDVPTRTAIPLSLQIGAAVANDFRDKFLIELDLETAFVRAHLERIPDDTLAWKGHERSMTLGWLATFLGNIWQWATLMVAADSFDVAKAQRERPSIVATSTAEILANFDNKIAEAREAIAGAPDAAFDQDWTLLADGHAIFTQPRWLVLRTYVMNHAVHHRAQLGVYLRLLDVPVPAVYNASADEQGGMFMK